MCMKVNNFDQFLNEKFFRKVFNSTKRHKTKGNRVENCVNNILDFLAENDIYNWDKFMLMSPFDRDVIDRIIDTQVRTMEELKEVRFKVKLELSNRQQLLEWKEELEQQEEFEKCAIIVKKLSQK